MTARNTARCYFAAAPDGESGVCDPYRVEERHIKTRSADGDRVSTHRIIDRRRDYYYERVVDHETGTDLRRVEERLSDHQGRGSARE